MNPSRWLLLLLLALDLRSVGAADLTVNLRLRVEAFKGSGEWRAVSLQQSLPVEKTAVLICDMWDKHWCRGATARVNGLVAYMEPFLESARKLGVQIIHAPSETMAFYQDAPQRKRILALAKIDPPPHSVCSILHSPSTTNAAGAIRRTSSTKPGRVSILVCASTHRT